MALHRLSSVTMGVPNPEETAGYYTDFGLRPETDGWFATRDGGRQLRVVAAPTRRLVEVRIGADDPDDLAAAAARLNRLGVSAQLDGTTLTAYEPATGVRAVLQSEARVTQPSTPATPYNGPGRIERRNVRAPGIVRDEPIQPRKLGHAVLGTTNFTATTAFFRDGLGFKVSDLMGDVGAFLRCSPDHHNILVLSAPVSFLHHTSWQVDDVDDVGRGAMAMLEDHPERHVWGLGRHHAGSNFFWYLKDPAGNFSEYYSDMDCVVDDQLWTPEVHEGAKGLFSWGPPPPPSFIRPEDLAALMTGSHSS
ncbi:VOC family protein [Actinoplanes derwentensis]|uniref:Glyoxalase/Bleomycin resistance protein/Dioxygenase superfamily protein n=1 Tax=Actinoplanes derwentensis TaxID=113562 RepID=A0A1H2DC30_9ACTN|nr:VOC family protein [Actinoplanes derwentensis]GID90200.1 dioxygenase [Actinoplanes derwentensis]SDT80308.1 Glyoxalase/Bleomycin resistance protein/Dioxygenase superfamily protein [Actinoplanes derwentensis]